MRFRWLEILASRTDVFPVTGPRVRKTNWRPASAGRRRPSPREEGVGRHGTPSPGLAWSGSLRTFRNSAANPSSSPVFLRTTNQTSKANQPSPFVANIARNASERWQSKDPTTRTSTMLCKSLSSPVSLRSPYHYYNYCLHIRRRQAPAKDAAVLRWRQSDMHPGRASSRHSRVLRRDPVLQRCRVCGHRV